jgi:hypothetical protein
MNRLGSAFCSFDGQYSEAGSYIDYDVACLYRIADSGNQRRCAQRIPDHAGMSFL